MYNTAGRLAKMLSAQDCGSAVHFVVLYETTIIGCINYTNIARGAFMACHLGFSIDKEFEGKGFMYQSLKFTLEHVQNVLKLHRVMANYMPHNKRSERLLERVGFKREGYAEKYLKINGKWEDHVLTSLIFDDV
jgi:[ribosomal protein S5]-alanine N-acetyltransferase